MTRKRLIFFGLGCAFLFMVLSAVNFVFNPLGLGPERQNVLPDSFFKTPRVTDELELLVDGKKAFKEILNALEKAESSIYVQTYIWKNDHIGRKIASALTDAGRRGVQVAVSKDALGTFFELKDILTGNPSPVFTESGLKNKRNINVSVKMFADTDHSKYYIIDDRVVILGGMNVADEYHRDWHDYMVKIQSPTWAGAFRKRVLSGTPWPADAPFFIAVNDNQNVEIRTALIEMIDRAHHSIIIEHAYFSTDKIVAAVKRAVERGVKVNIILPQEPDTHRYANWVTINELLKTESAAAPHIFLFPKMMHAKVILVDGVIAAVGSANLTLRSMLTSREVALFFHGEPDHPFISELRRQLVADMIESKEVRTAFEIDLVDAAKAKVDKYMW